MLALRRSLTSVIASAAPLCQRPLPLRPLASTGASPAEARSRKWPDEPRVGVGVVALRASPLDDTATEVRGASRSA